jgi:hypothetical protein
MKSITQFAGKFAWIVEEIIADGHHAPASRGGPTIQSTYWHLTGIDTGGDQRVSRTRELIPVG